jgi:hypothetical protein
VPSSYAITSGAVNLNILWFSFKSFNNSGIWIENNGFSFLSIIEPLILASFIHPLRWTEQGDGLFCSTCVDHKKAVPDVPRVRGSKPALSKSNPES